MRKIIFSTAVVGALIGTSIAQESPEIVVQSSRAVATTIGRTSTGIPIQDVTLSYGVSTKGLDLTTAAGKQELERRVRETAAAACKELGRQYPSSTTSDADCAKTATSKAMVDVQKVEAAAAKK